MKNWYGILLGSCLILLIIGSIISIFTSTPVVKQMTTEELLASLDSSNTNYPSGGPIKEVEVANWNYSQESDPMTDKEMYFAQCTSSNSLFFDFPYDGGYPLIITVRKMNGKNEVLLQIAKGQFSRAEIPVKIRFDDETLKSYDFDFPADASSNYIFLHSPSTIIDKLKSAKEVKIEAPFYQGGKQVAEFSVSNFVWKH